jgi:hypothetical protein
MNYAPCGVQRARTGSSSTATTLLANAQTDVVNCRVWEDFSGQVSQMYNDLNAGDMWKKHVSRPVCLSAEPFIDVANEMNMASVHSNAAFQPAKHLVHSFGVRGCFHVKRQRSCLEP